MDNPTINNATFIPAISSSAGSNSNETFNVVQTPVELKKKQQSVSSIMTEDESDEEKPIILLKNKNKKELFK